MLTYQILTRTQEMIGYRTLIDAHFIYSATPYISSMDDLSFENYFISSTSKFYNAGIAC